MSENFITRRKFLKQSGIIAVGFSLTSNCHTNREYADSEIVEFPSSLSRHPQIDSWLQVLENGRVLIYTGKMELGQGIRTAIAQVAAEELNTSPDLVEVHLAETDVTPDEGYTAGSRSIETSAMSVRYAAATASEILLERASSKLQIGLGNLYLENGFIRIRNENRKISFNEAIEGEQIQEEVRSRVSLKSKNDRQWVGEPVQRKDITRMVRGEPVYVQDLRFPGMVHARIIRPVGYDAELLNYNERDLKDHVNGVLKLVVRGSFMGVITEDEYQAVRAQQYLERNTKWSDSRKLPAGESLKEYLKTLSSETEDVATKGQVKFGDQKINASFFRPYTMHAAMGPSCAVAIYREDRLQVWTHSQGVYPLRRSLQALVGIPLEKIRVTGIPGSGCYGHNGADDAAADAALLAMSYPDRHVRLQWSRSDEHGWEPYGSAMIMKCEAELGLDGKIKNWLYDLWSDVHSTRPGGNAANLLPSWYLEDGYDPPQGGFFGGASRNALPYYSIPNLKIRGNSFKGPFRVSALRGLGGYANIFAIECFMDELAEKAGMDPLDFRLNHLEDYRAREVILKIREMTSGEKMQENEGLGYAFSRYKNEASYTAMAAKVRIDDEGKPEIVRMWGAIDSGEVINPDGLKNQTEGGMIQSASWMLKEQVSFDVEQITSLDWYGYPILLFKETPEVTVKLIDRSDQPPLGVGEAAQGPTSAAIANALYYASGKRIRDLPVSTHYS